MQLILQHDNAAESSALHGQCRERFDNGTNGHGRIGPGNVTDYLSAVAVIAERATFLEEGLRLWCATASL